MINNSAAKKDCAQVSCSVGFLKMSKSAFLEKIGFSERLILWRKYRESFTAEGPSKFTDKALEIRPWSHTGCKIGRKMSFNILQCRSHETTRDLGRGACIPVTYHVNMHHANMGVTSKVSTQVHWDPAITPCWEWFETGCNSRQFFQAGSPRVAPKRTAVHILGSLVSGDYCDNGVFVALPVTIATQKNVRVHLNIVANVKTVTCTKLPYVGVMKIWG